MIQVRRFRPRPLLLLALVGVIGSSGCDKPQSLGDPNALIIGAAGPAWAEMQEEVETALEPRAFTVRDERIFRVTHVDPEGPTWGDLRRFQQVLLIGEPGDEWIAQALDRAGQPLPQLPAVVEARNVWARGQRVLALVVPPGASPSEVRILLPAVGERLLRDYRQFVQQRMYASGVDSVRLDSLRQQIGASVLVPSVYRTGALDPNTYLFINDQPDPSQLQRAVLVTWRPSAEVDLSPEAILAWREQVGTRYYEPAQQTDRERIEQVEVRSGGGSGLQVQGVWSTPAGGWPAAGPFLARAIACPDGRTYLLDSWVYAPGREKYEYLFQLHTILETFECPAQRGS